MVKSGVPPAAKGQRPRGQATIGSANTMPYAVIRTGGKQYRVNEGDNLRIEKIEGEVGQEVEFADVLMLGDGEKAILDAAELEAKKVKAKILRHGRGKKIHVYKFKRRKGYERRQGHRQSFTEVCISSIS